VFKVEVYARVRRSVQVDGMSIRQAPREFGLARKTVRKMLAYSVPPGYERKKPVTRPKLGPWPGVIDQVLEDDKAQPKKILILRLQLHQIHLIPVGCWSFEPGTATRP
jgi:hypothetical protein